MQGFGARRRISGTTSWPCRRARSLAPQAAATVRIINAALSSLAMEKHPGKTFIGRADKGFDFLGYRISPGGLMVSQSTIKRFRERTRRLYEQERAGRYLTGTLGDYVRRWSPGRKWDLATRALAGLRNRLPCDARCSRLLLEAIEPIPTGTGAKIAPVLGPV